MKNQANFTNPNSNLSLTRKITLLSTIIALSPVVAFLCLANPLSISSASATSANSRTRVNIEPVASIAIEAYDPTTSSYTNNSNLSMVINPDNFNTMSARITTSTNSPTGLTLYLSDSDTNNSMVEQHDTPSSPTEPVISSITSNVTINDTTDSTKLFPTNTWGYAFNSNTANNNNSNNNNANTTTPPTIPLIYSPIPTTETTLDETDTNGDTTYTFTAGSRIDMSLPAGIYKDQLTFTVIANPIPVYYTPLHTLNNQSMQDGRLADVCSEAITPLSTATRLDTDGSHAQDNTYVPSITMIDQRDGQQYTIRKLADGNCWMTENLRYGANLDNSARPWNNAIDARLTDTTAEGAAKLSDLDNGLIVSHIITGSTGQAGADGNPAFSDRDEYYTKPYIAIYDANTIDNVSGTNTKFGALYNYCAASGGTICEPKDTPTTPIPTNKSICPAGWTLPDFNAEVGVQSGTNASYNNLTEAYGIVVGTVDRVNKILAIPLSFPRAGYFQNGNLLNRSNLGHGLYWSSLPCSRITACNLGFDSAANIARNGRARYSARSVRCVASGN